MQQNPHGFSFYSIPCKQLPLNLTTVEEEF